MASRIPVYSMSVDEYRGHWWFESYGPEQSFALESVNLEIAVKDLYEGVVLRPWPASIPEPPTNPI